MPADSVLVVDAGTSAMRAVLVRADGDVAPLGAEPYRTFVPDDAVPFGRELNPADLAQSLQRLLALAAPHRPRIAAIAFTGQREGLAFIDGRGDTLLASPNVDARASAEGIAIDAAHAGDVYAATGHLPSLMQAPAKLQWLRTHRHDLAARVARVLPLVDWLAMLLTRVPAISRTLAAENGLLDVSSGAVPDTLLGMLGVDVSLVPPVVADGTIVGEATGGELAGLPVALAGADTQCALLGMSAAAPGTAGVPAGWTAPVQMVTASPVFDDERRTWTGVHVAPGAWILESNAGETGRAWEWLRGLLAVSNDEAARLTAASPAGACDAMCITGARVMRAAEMNAGIGALTFPLPLVMSAPDRGDVLRAMLEATAYAVRANLEQLEQVSGASVERLLLGGGMSRSALFTHIVADVVGRPLAVAPSADVSALGAAALASLAAGLHRSLDGALAAMTAGGRTIEPVLATSAAYEDLYARWCALSDEMIRLAAEVG